MKKQLFYGFSFLYILASLASCSKDYGYNFENGYSSGEYEDTVNVNIDTNRFKIDYSKITQARLFPGVVATTEPRLENYKVSIDLNYVEVSPSDLRISVAPGAWQSTSMFAPAGELIVIDVPQGVYGLKAQVGPHVYTGSTKIEFPRRDEKIVVSKDLFPGKNYIRNLYGGLVYIIPERPLGRVVDLLFSGTTLAPSFKLGKMTDQQWKDLVNKSSVPWFELEGNRIVFTLQTERLKRFPINSPTELMELWDKMIKEAYWDWTGMTEGNPDVKHRAPFNKWRIVHDVLFEPGVAQVSGYPVRAGANDQYFGQAVTINSVRTQNWGTYHELGHNMQQGRVWSFDGNGEVTNNLFSFKVAMINGRQHTKIAEVWPTGLEWINYVPKDAADANRKIWANMPTLSKNHNDAKLIMYAQIFEKYGYGFMTYLYTRARNARFESANDQSKIDFFYEALCEYTKVDMEPFLWIGWGIKVSDVSRNYVKFQLGLPLLNKKFWLFNPVTRSGGEDPYYDIIEVAKTGWTATASNYNPSYEPKNMIDGNLTTFWNSCWNTTCTPANSFVANGPWVINLQTGANAISASGISFTQRQVANSTNHVKNFKLEVSDDNVSWRSLGTFTVTRDLPTQYVYFNSGQTAETFKYARLTVNKSDLYVTTDFPVIAELGFYNNR